MSESILTQSTIKASSILQTKVCFVPNILKPAQHEALSIRECLDRMAAHDYTDLHNQITFGGDADYKRAKEKLPAVVFSGSVAPGQIVSGKHMAELSGVMVLDIDKLDDADALLARVREDPHTLFAFISPSNGGLKVGVYCDYLNHGSHPSPTEYTHYYRAVLEQAAILWTGIVFDKSSCNINRLCFCSPSPAYVAEAEVQPFNVEKYTKPIRPEVKTAQYTEARMTELLKTLDASMCRADWYKVLGAVHSDSEGWLDLITEWSSWGANYKGPEEVENIWLALDSSKDNITQMATVEYMARKAGYVPSTDWSVVMAQLNLPPVCPEEIFGGVGVLPEIIVDDIKTDLDYPPGVVGETARYIFQSSRLPVKSYAIAGALTALAYLNRNQAWIGPSNTSLNLYQCIIGSTGQGKEEPRKAIKKLVDAFESGMKFTPANPDETVNKGGVVHGLCETLSSGAALVATLSEETRHILMMSDEFGLLLQIAISDKGSIHQKELFKELMAFYGLGQSFYAGKKYAESSRNIRRIEKPYVNVIGTTTATELIDGITTRSVNNGLLNRILFINAWGVGDINRNPNTLICPELTGKILSNARKGPISYAPGAMERLISYAATIKLNGGEYADLWVRAEEQIIRVAGVVAMANDSMITLEIIEWAYKYVTLSIKDFSSLLGNDLAENIFEKRIAKAKKIIARPKHYINDKKFATILKAGLMPHGKLSKLMKLNKFDLTHVIDHLIDSKEITALKHGNAVIYKTE